MSGLTNGLAPRNVGTPDHFVVHSWMNASEALIPGPRKLGRLRKA